MTIGYRQVSDRPMKPCRKAFNRAVEGDLRADESGYVRNPSRPAGLLPEVSIRRRGPLTQNGMLLFWVFDGIGVFGPEAMVGMHSRTSARDALALSLAIHSEHAAQRGHEHTENTSTE